MESQHRKTVPIIVQTGKVITLFLIGGITVHTLIMFLDYYLGTEPLYLDLHKNFVGSIFSVPMIPMVGAYGILLLAIYYFWDRKKKALIFAHKKEVQSEKVELVFKSMQRITGILAEHIATHNAEIMTWVESRKIRGQQVSKKVENPTRKIAKALQSLSELSFVFPYTDNHPKHVEDIEKILQSKLDEMTGSQESKDELAKQLQCN